MNKTLLINNENGNPDFNTANFEQNFNNKTEYEEIQYKSPLKLIYASSPLEKPYNFIFKRIIDIILSSFLIVFFLSWLIPIIAILIKFDSPGPVFFLQKRNKKDGKIFVCIKFRSMIVNKEADKFSAYENDHRITAIGKILRHYHLDELPQLFNVLWGDMSIIGPRPHMVVENMHYEKMLNEYACRHQIKPGITGLAQSFGMCGSTNDLHKIKERVDVDLVYINQWSAKMDIQILLRTFRKISGI